MSVIEITVGGVDVSHNVLYETCSFESQLGAFPGSFEFTVKDENQEFSFDTGSEVTMSIDGTRYYGGYVMTVTRQFAFPVDDTVTDGPTAVKTRQWVLRGVDYNILFDKRVVYNKATPTELIPLFSATTTDQSVLLTLFDDYLNLEDDGLDTTTFVDEVGDPTPDGSEGAYVNPGEPWRKQMEDIANLTGGIWYIDSEKKIHYQTVEDTAVTWGFSDTPDHATTFGFREFEFIEDATNVVNDALVWGGSPYGSTGVTGKTVFAETENETSQAAVGRWQLAEKHFNEVGFFRTTGVAVRGNVLVYGYPTGPGDTAVGLQNPQKNIRLVWFSGTTPTPLVAGTVVTVTLNVYDGLVVVLPVRSIRITFPVNYAARFDAFLGIQTSDPWSLWKYLKRVYQARQKLTIGSIATGDGTDGDVLPGTRVCTTPTPTANGAIVTFTVPYGYVAQSTQVYKNGLLQRPGFEYEESDPEAGEITFTNPPATSSTLWACYLSL